MSLVDEKSTEEWVIRTMEVTQTLHPSPTDKSKVLKVVQFQFLVWPRHTPPMTTASILDLMENVNRRQMTQRRVPIIVMCK